jgi:amino acid transporter
MIRGIDLRGAVAVNVITMIGIGPLITIPLVLANLHGSAALWAWGLGALIALCDGLVYAELGSLYPGSGGSYVFLREAFGRERWGRLLAFLFAWQFVVSAPLVIATGYIGFAHYAGYLWAPLANDATLQGAVAAALGVVTLVLLYRPIRIVGAVGVVLAGIAVATLGALVAAAAAHGHVARSLDGDPHAPLFAALLAGLGPSLVITLYDYAGYGQACTIGDEVREPARVLPRSIVISVLLVGALYAATQVGVLAIVPWRELIPATPDGAPPALANFVASSAIERVWGLWPARVMTLAVLVTAFASTYGGLLGASRVPYAAALDGVFFRPFARLHARGRFPTVSLVVLGLVALPACFFSLGDVINALTAGIVLAQSLAQIVGLVLLRVRGSRAPYRMWLYPVPAIVAFAGWTWIFFSSGRAAIVYGLVTLAIGIAAYLVRARRARDWPFLPRAAATAALALLAGTLAAAVPLEARAAASWGNASIVTPPGRTEPEFRFDGKPFFLYGAAFFYERLPAESWRASMLELRGLGINTLDLYVPWNWHELADGDFDFSGRTNPRRDLDEVLRLARELDFAIVLRPGPVIRNEWRNGGYPAWLLARPEYGMPQHDLLEGRYPPTATLQNAHSDDAAAEWMRNATHLTYAKRWLERVLRECEPDAGRILAVALDDDQGAYIDNQTFPAPHFQRYIAWLRDVVHGVTGPHELTFINTYQMKVTASSPVWAMGNWYQSEAYALGEHDRAQLDFSTALLHTRPGQPSMASEFQAGWLEQPADALPRPADPANTSLAIATMVAQGVRGIVNFPAQDTLYPAGWEAPFANAFYAWDAALTLDGAPSPRAVPTRHFGDLVRAYGSTLAASPVRYDAAIAYLGESVRVESATNAFFGDLEGQTIAAQRACRDAGLTCALVDPVALDRAALARYPLLVLPYPPGIDASSQTNAARERLRAYAAGGGIALVNPSGSALARAFAATGRRAEVEGAADATFAPDPARRIAGFLTVLNYDGAERAVSAATVALSDGSRLTLAPFVVPAHDALVAAIGTDGRALPVDAGAAAGAVTSAPPEAVPVRTGVWVPSPAATFAPADPGIARAYAADVYRDGASAFVLDNGIVRVAVVPQAGARAFVFEDDATGRNVFTTVGALRDDVAIEPPLSTTDRIAKYTHQFPAGTFNRKYAATIEALGPAARASFTYDAPDVVPNGARFERTLSLPRGSHAFTAIVRAAFPGAAANDPQRAVSVTSLAVGDGTDMSTRRVLAPAAVAFASDTTLHVTTGDALGYYDVATHELATIAWRRGDVEDAAIEERRDSIVTRLRLARTPECRLRYATNAAPDASAAEKLLAAEDAAAQTPEARAPRSPGDR